MSTARGGDRRARRVAPARAPTPGRAVRRQSGRARRHSAQRVAPSKPEPAATAPRPQRLAFTTRSAVLGLALCAVLLTLAFPLKEFLGQRAQIAAEQLTQRATRARIAELTREHAVADNPAQIEAEARSRLHYTFPGQRNYIVVPSTRATQHPTTRHGHATVPYDPAASWYGRLLRSDLDAAASGGH